jgi:hypothetical protein
MKILPMGASLFHAEGRPEMTKLSFRNFANAPKKGLARHPNLYLDTGRCNRVTVNTRSKVRFTQRRFTYLSIALQPTDVTESQLTAEPAVLEDKMLRIIRKMSMSENEKGEIAQQQSSATSAILLQSGKDATG